MEPFAYTEGGRRRRRQRRTLAPKQIVCGKLYASWCHFCKDLEEPWKQLLTGLSKDPNHVVCINKEVALGDEDESKHDAILTTLTKQLGARQKIQVKGGYPTIFKLDNFNNVVYHEGARTLEELTKFFAPLASQFNGLRSKKHLVQNTGSNRKKQTGGCWPWTTRKTHRRRRSVRKF
jgi:hypothetical protein